MNIFILFFSLVLLNVQKGSAAAVQKIIVPSGSSVTFYCDKSVYYIFKKCECKFSNSCYYHGYKAEPHLDQIKNTVLDLTSSDSGCYRCNQQVYDLEVLPENGPSVVIGKPGGSVVMSCAIGKNAHRSELYWCREDLNGNCLKLNIGNSWRENLNSKGMLSLEKQDLSPEDSGRYQGVLNSNTLYKTTCAINLQVLQSQNGLHAPLTFNVMPGQEVKVACKYIQDYLNAPKSWECSSQLHSRDCSTGVEVYDDRSRSELVLSIANVKMSDNGNVYTCKVAKSDGGFHNVSMTLMVGVTAPRNVNGTKGGNVTIRCNYYKKDYITGKFWCKLNSAGKCEIYFYNQDYQDIRNRGRTIEYSNYFDLILEHLQISDSGTYRCGYEQRDDIKGFFTLRADVDLSIIDPQIPSTTMTTTTTTTTTRTTATKSGKTGSSTISSNPLLYGIFGLLAVIAITLLIILVKLYCKRHSDRAQSPVIGGGTFHMNDVISNIHLMSPERPVLQQPYTGSMDDSSSTSSESSGHSFGNISFGPRNQYLSIIPTPTNADYENVPEEMHPALPDYENGTTDKDHDYVNISEAQNSSSTEDKESESESEAEAEVKACQPAGNCEERAGSSESSSDESDEESVNYSTVVFKKAPE